MTDTPTPVADPRPPRAAFLVGVTGYMDLAEADRERVKAQVGRILRFIKEGAAGMDPASNRPLLDLLLDDLAPPGDAPLRRALKHWHGLRHTPIIVLSGLAPGADTIVAEAALEGTVADVSLRAPLAFPRDLYPSATTFVRSKAAQEENGRRQEKVRELLDMIPPDDAYAVRLDGEIALTEAEMSRKLAGFITGSDPAVKAERDKRYYAAGEYIAVYAHLLIAVWTGENEASEAGTAAVVRARMLGPKCGLLANTMDLAVPHGGPVLHVVARRKDADSEPGLPHLRVLHPYLFAVKPPDPDATIVGEGQERDVPLQTQRLETFLNTARELDELNALPESGKLEGRFVEMLAATSKVQARLPAAERDKTPPLMRFAVDLKTTAPALHHGLRVVSDVRRRAAGASYALTDGATATVWWLFVAAFVMALAFHVFTEWEASPAGASAAEAGPAVVAARAASQPVLKPAERAEGTARAERAGSVRPPEAARAPWDVIRVFAGGIAVAAAAAGLTYFFWVRRRRTDERAHDYRALAEGLRVQFYWNLAGLGRSVAAGYMQRQRGELDWIRGAIRAVSFPYHRWPAWFAALPGSGKVLALQCVLRGWVQEQSIYFSDRFKQHHYDLHSCHRLGGAAAITAIMVFATCWVTAVRPDAAEAMPRHPFRILAIGSALLAGAAFLNFLLKWSGEKHHEAEEKPAEPGWLKRLRWRQAPTYLARLYAAEGAPFVKRTRWEAVVDVFLPDAEERPTRVRSLAGWLTYLLVTAGAAAVIEFVCQSAPASSRWVPRPEKLQAILGAALLLSAALTVAWAEKRLFSELAYQYNTMASLFRHAEQRLASGLRRLDPAQPDFPQKLGEIQDFLYALGKEALDENAEWLILHRARPLEPVMPG